MKKNKKHGMRTWTNYESQKGYEDYTGQVSIVVPDQAFTVKQIFDKFRVGITLPLDREVYYSGTDDFDHPDEFELNDITDFYEVKNLIGSERNRQKAEAAKNDLSEQAKKSTDEPKSEKAFQAANQP